MNKQEGSSSSFDGQYVVVGLVQAHFGVKGWVKVISFTRPSNEILNFENWSFVEANRSLKSAGVSSRTVLGDTVVECDRTLELLEGRFQGKGLIVRLAGIENRELAESLIGATVVIHRDQFAQLDEGEYYWTDLLGLRVINLEGHEFGTIDHLVETGANDVMVIHKVEDNGQCLEVLIPWVDQYVLKVDLEKGDILVDWDAD